MGITQGFIALKGVTLQGQRCNENLFSKRFRPVMIAEGTNFINPFVVSGQEIAASVRPVTVKVEEMAQF